MLDSVVENLELIPGVQGGDRVPTQCRAQSHSYTVYKNVPTAYNVFRLGEETRIPRGNP